MAGSSPSVMAVDSAPATPVVRHAFIVPARLTESSQFKAPRGADAGLEILFAHESAKIVAFDASSPLQRTSSAGARVNVDENAVGVLPWTSAIERTIAAGPIRLYRLHSVAFLSSGRILHAILPKSRCWCVDGKSKFVLRIRSNSYWRIEISVTEDDKTKLEELKVVFPQILRYETTACPFQRAFTIELPEPPKTPPRKRPWKAPQRPKVPKVEASPGSESADEYTTAPSEADSPSEQDEESDSGTTDSMELMEATPRANRPSASVLFADNVQTPSRSNTPLSRSSIGPPQLTIETSSPAVLEKPWTGRESKPTDFSSLSSSVESFYSFHSPTSPLPPSPPDSNPSSPTYPSEKGHKQLNVCRFRKHKRDLSEVTVTSSCTAAPMPPEIPHYDDRERSPIPSTPTLIADSCDQEDEDRSEIATAPRSEGVRQRSSHRRTLSPLPLAANLISPTVARSRLTSALIQKACSLMLGPPFHLISLMLSIASRIANGALRGTTYSYGETGDRIPCHWDYSDEDDVCEGETWAEDDFGVPLIKKEVPQVKKDADSRSWEID